MTSPSARIRACLPIDVRERFDGGGTWAYPVFNTVEDLAQGIVELLGNMLPDLLILDDAGFKRLLAEFDDGGSMRFYRPHLMNERMNKAAADIVEFIANYYDQQTMETTTMTDDQQTPTEPPPASSDFDTFAEAKRRAGVALLSSVEAAANHYSYDPLTLVQLARAYRTVTDSPAHAEAIIAELGTTLDPTECDQLESLGLFYEGIRHVVGLPPTRSDEPRCTAQSTQETLQAVNALRLKALRVDELEAEVMAFRNVAAGHDALHDLRRKGGTLPRIVGLALDELLAWQRDAQTTDKLRSELQAANEQVQSLFSENNCHKTMLLDLDGVIKAEHAKIGIPPRTWLPQDTHDAIESAYARLDVAARARHIARIAMIRQMSEVGARDRTIVRETRDALAGHGFADHELTVGRVDQMAAALTAVRAELATIRDLLAKDGFTDDQLPRAVETALDSLLEARKERDSNRQQLDAANKRIVAIGECLEGRAKLDVDIGDVDITRAFDIRAQYMTAKATLAQVRDDLTEKLAEAQAEIGAMGVALNEAKKWTPLTFEVNSHGRRLDVLRALAARAEAWHDLAKLLNASGVPNMPPALMARSLIDQRDSMRATILGVQEALGVTPSDAARPPSGGSSADTVKEVASVVAQLNQLRGEQVCLSDALFELIDFWRRGEEPYRLAATDLEKQMKASLGEAYWSLLASATSRKKRRPNVVLGVAAEDLRPGDHVEIDPHTGKLRKLSDAPSKSAVEQGDAAQAVTVEAAVAKALERWMTKGIISPDMRDLLARSGFDSPAKS